MEIIDWAKELPSAVTLTDKYAKIIYLNDVALSTFADDGGEKLIGTSLFDCHNDNSNKIINQIIATKEPNIYTIEKNGKKKLIYQAPYFNGGEFSGLVEISIVLPENMPHFIRS